MILKKCKICQSSFEDTTKSHNKKFCGSLECKKIQTRIHNSKVDKEKRKQQLASFRHQNPDYLKRWREANRERDREINREYIKTRYHSDAIYRLAHILRTRLFKCAKGMGISAPKALGCSIEELQKHLETKFLPGMSWENYGLHGWHIDHIIPLDSADSPEQVERLCHFTNLQPLWAIDNWKKGNKNGTL